MGIIFLQERTMKLTETQSNMLTLLGTQVEYAGAVWTVKGLDMVDNTVILMGENYRIQETALASVKPCVSPQK